MENTEKHTCSQCEYFDDGFIYAFCWLKKNYDNTKMKGTDEACKNFQGN